MIFKKRHAIGAKPGTLVMPATRVAPKIRVLEWSVGGELTDRAVGNASELAADSEQMRWIDVQGLGDEPTLRQLAATFGIDDLALEDIVNTPQRPKTVAYPNHQLVIVRMARVSAGTSTHEQVSLLIFGRTVLSFQDAYGDVLDPVRERLRVPGSRLRASGPEYLSYAIIDTIVDGYYPVIETLGDNLEELEEAALARPQPSVLRELSKHRVSLLALRRAAWPMRELMRTMSSAEGGFSAEVRRYLRETHDHLVQLAEVIESYREILSGIMNTYLSSVGNRTNEIMRVLTLMASIFIPLTFIAGLYGMNFEAMPELKWRFGYPVALSVMAAMAVSMWLWFRRAGWVGRPTDPDGD